MSAKTAYISLTLRHWLNGLILVLSQNKLLYSHHSSPDFSVSRAVH